MRPGRGPSWGQRLRPDRGGSRGAGGARDIADEDDGSPIAGWFTTAAARPVRTGNDVTPFTDGDAYFADVAAAIRGAAGEGSFVELVGWDLQTDFELVPGDPASTLGALLSGASGRGVEVRGLVNRHQDNPFGPGTVTGYDNSPAVETLAALPTGSVVHDERYLYAGTHHQKIAVVGTRDGVVAYSGGMDFNPNRLRDHPEHKHDVQLRLTGAAALDHHRLFAERWADHPASADLRPFPDVPVEPLPAGASPSDGNAPGGLQAQVVATYGNGSDGTISPGRGSERAGYAFAPTGEASVSDLVFRAISRARRFIYLEDQYLVNMAVSAALAAALPRIERLVILVPETDAVNRDLQQGWRRRRAFLKPLLKAGPHKVHVCRSTAYYVHSKVWVFDDEFAIVGSANCNRRGYSHDSEQAVGVYEPGPYAERGWVRELRAGLWAKHLDVPRGELDDAIASAHLWTAPPPGAKVAPYDLKGGSDNPPFPRGTDRFWDAIIDPA